MRRKERMKTEQWVSGGPHPAVGRKRRGSMGKSWKKVVLVRRSLTFELFYRRGFGYSAAWVERAGRRVEMYESPLWWDGVKNMKRRRSEVTQDSGVAVASLDVKKWVELLPIIQHLAVRRYDDGEARTPGTITLRTIGSLWQAMCKDPDTRQEMPVVAQTFEDLLFLTAATLDAPDAVWQPDPWAEKMFAQKKKK